MNETKDAERRLVVEQLASAREKLRATGATVLSPTSEWTVLQKEIATLKRKLR